MSDDPSKTSLGDALANAGYEMLEYADCWQAHLAWNLTIAALFEQVAKHERSVIKEMAKQVGWARAVVR